MLRYILRRVAAMVPLLLVIVGFVFFLGQYGANDLAMSMTLRVNDGVFDAQIYEAMREKLDLADPVIVRFVRFIGNAARGEFGVSYALQGTPDIGRMIGKALPISMQLGLVAMLMCIVVGIPLGVISAAWRNSVADYLIVGGATVLSSVPAFVLAPIALVVLVGQLHILPTVGTGWHGLLAKETLLPAACLAAGPLLGIVRYTRASVVDTLSQEYIRAAHARGLAEWQVIVRHVIKNSMTPVLTTLGLATARLLSGSIFIETVFSIQGLGSVAVTAFQAGDIQTVAATTLVSAMIVMAANIVVDLCYGMLDPRVRLTA